MPVVRTTSWLLAFALAALATGCPAPTGRHRGSVITDVFCTNSEMPVAGGPCSIEGDTCPIQRSCNGTGFETLTCTCQNGFWSCREGPCEMPFVDAEVLGCPAEPVRHGDSCSPRQGGLYCSGSIDCGGGAMPANCWCTGSAWSCSAPGCFDAGFDGGEAGVPFCDFDAATICTTGMQCTTPSSDGCTSVCECMPFGSWACGAPLCGGDASTE